MVTGFPWSLLGDCGVKFSGETCIDPEHGIGFVYEGGVVEPDEWSCYGCLSLEEDWSKGVEGTDFAKINKDIDGYRRFVYLNVERWRPSEEERSRLMSILGRANSQDSFLEYLRESEKLRKEIEERVAREDVG